MPIISGSLLGDRYEIISRLGVGSFGVVYKVKRLSDEKIVAVKEVRLESFASNKPSVEGEFSIFPHLTHPNIATYYLQTYDAATNCYLIEMECYDRGNLKAYIQEYRRNKIDIPEEEIWRVSSEILLALDYLHTADKQNKTKGVIIHRDIKPENILLTHDNHAKLCDFGASRLLKPSAMADSVVGSPLFMAPEVAYHKGYREPVDIWSLGCVMINMCTRMAPQVIRNKSYDQLQDIRPNIPDTYSHELVDFIASCLRINPSHRITVQQALKHPRIITHLHEDSLVISLMSRNDKDAISNNPVNLTKQASLLETTQSAPNSNTRNPKHSRENSGSIIKSRLSIKSTDLSNNDIRSLNMPSVSPNTSALPNENVTSLRTNASTGILRMHRHVEDPETSHLSISRVSRQSINYIPMRFSTSAEYNIYAATLRDGTTGLMLAAMVNDIEALNDLLSVQARLQDKRGRTALMRATEYGNVEAVAILSPLESRQTDVDAHTALMYSAKFGKANCTSLLLQVEGRCRKRNGWTALMTAIELGNLEIVSILKPKEEDITMVDGTTSLMIAAKVGNVACLQMLVEAGVGKVDESGFFALLWAIVCNNPPCVSTLLPYELHMVDKNGKTAYQWAREKKRKECILLIEEYCRAEGVKLQY